MKSALLALACVLALAATVACADPDEFAEFDADDTSTLSECMAEQFPFEANFFAARTRNDRTGIFLQTEPDVKSRSDIVYFEIYDPENLPLGEPIEFGEASVPPPPARGKMVFFSSCPYQTDSLELRGSLQFDSFDTDAHGVISGQLVDASVVDDRSDEVRIEEFTGAWEFVVRKGPPHEDFYALPERP